MAGNVKLMTSAGGGVVLDTATTTATDVTVKVPARACTLLGDGASTLTSGTTVNASGTSVDFTSIPSWVKRITVMFGGVSTNGASHLLIQIGTSGGLQTTGYNATSTYTGVSSGGASTGDGFINYYDAASRTIYGSITLTLLNSSSGLWVASGVTVPIDIGGYTNQSAGTKTLSGTLARVRITTVNGTDTFDAGSINILYE